MGAGACANLTVMSDQPASAPDPRPASRRGKGMSLDVFMPENRKSRERAEARKRAVKQWLRRFLKRSPGTQAADLD
jgi:hypothetical protein